MVLLVSTGIGGLVFSALESSEAVTLNQQYKDAMVLLRYQLKQATGNDNSYYRNLLGVVGASDPSAVPDDTWGLHSYRAFLFSFTIITTIGYGEIAPKTAGGRIWLCAYSIIFIPMAGVALTKARSRALCPLSAAAAAAAAAVG